MVPTLPSESARMCSSTPCRFGLDCFPKIEAGPAAPLPLPLSTAEEEEEEEAVLPAAAPAKASRSPGLP